MANEEQKMSLGEASNSYYSSLKSEKRLPSQEEVGKFVRWFGKERPLTAVTPADIESYGERLSASDADYDKKLQLIRAFLAHAKKKSWTETNLGVHLKAKRGKGRGRVSVKQEAPETISLTEQGFTELKAELASLEEERHHLTGEIRKAAADKDFRENAPLHAAREKKGHVEGRIMQLEVTLKAAVVIDEKRKGGKRVGLGDSVVICEVDTAEEICYRLVTPKEVDVKRGKISNVSPMGQAILGRAPGDVVEISAPVGKLRFRIVRIER